MPLSNSYVQVYGQLPEFFKKIADGEAPAKFTTQLLKDWGYTSSNWRAAIPLLKSLGFLDASGTPTARYHSYRNGALSRAVMAEAIREAYKDIFVLKSQPSEAADKALVIGKFKSAHNCSEAIAKHMASTFFALLKLADMSSSTPTQVAKQEDNTQDPPPNERKESEGDQKHRVTKPSLHYNIQIHLPPTKDLEVYNAIFKSLKEHLLE